MSKEADDCGGCFAFASRPILNYILLPIQLQEVLCHKWMISGEPNGVNVETNKMASPFFSSDGLPVLSGEEDADPDVLLSMSSLGCFREKEKLLQNLMSSE